jgi:hypothetical protein
MPFTQIFQSARPALSVPFVLDQPNQQAISGLPLIATGAAIIGLVACPVKELAAWMPPEPARWKRVPPRRDSAGILACGFTRHPARQRSPESEPGFQSEGRAFATA